MIYPADQEQTVFYNPVQVQNRDLSVLMIALYAERRRKRMHLKEYRKKLRTEENLTGDALKDRLVEYETTLDATELVRSEDTGEDGMTILDALAASGLRSIRYWKEIPGVKHVTINDLDPAAVERAHTNLSVNNLADVLTNDDRGHGIRILCGDATHEMYLSRRTPGLRETIQAQLLQKDQWDIIDLDPYGSAAPFIDAAVQAVRDGGMLCVTCTDMAALGGSHPETAYGRYAGMPIQRAKYLQEFALRILLHALAVSAARYGRTIKPILSVGMAFYVRVFVEVSDDKAGVSGVESISSLLFYPLVLSPTKFSPLQVKDLSLNIGSVYQSTQCPSFHTAPHGQQSKNNKNVYQAARAPIFPQCEETGAPFKVGGPIWLGPLHDCEAVETAVKRLESKSESVVPDMKWIATRTRLHGLLTSVSEELPDVPLYYTLPDLCSTLHCACPPTIKMKAALVNAGYRLSAYHKEPLAIKTDAPNRVVWDILRAWCKENPPPGSTKRSQKHDDNVKRKILDVEPSIKVDFSVPKVLDRKKKAQRFPENPEKNWGPKPRASGSKRKADGVAAL